MENAIEITRKAIVEYKTLETSDFFKMLERSLLSKCFIMRKYPHIYAFSLRAYYETFPEIKEAIQKSYSKTGNASETIVFEKIDTSVLRQDIDLKSMYSEIFYAVDGYMLNKYRSGKIVPAEIENEITLLIDLWKKLYAKREDC